MNHIAANVDRDLENYKWKSKTNHCHSLDRRPSKHTYNQLHNRFWILYAGETQESGHKVRTKWTSDFVFVVVCCAAVCFDLDGLLMNSANAKRWHQINCKLIKFENSILGCSGLNTAHTQRNKCLGSYTNTRYDTTASVRSDSIKTETPAKMSYKTICG